MTVAITFVRHFITFVWFGILSSLASKAPPEAFEGWWLMHQYTAPFLYYSQYFCFALAALCFVCIFVAVGEAIGTHSARVDRKAPRH